MKRLLYVILQCTWGSVQTLLGFIFFLATTKCPHRIYRGCIDTNWNVRGGLSLGLFIFTPPENYPNSQSIRVHEYGHTIQSLILGPLYLIVVGIVSVTWANLPSFKKCAERMAFAIPHALWNRGQADWVKRSPASALYGINKSIF